MRYGRKPVTGSVSRHLRRGALISLCLLFAATAQVDTAGAGSLKSALVIPRVVVDGMDKYKFNGADGAVKNWLQPTRARTQETAAAYAAALPDAEEVYGKFIDYHLVSIKRLSPAAALIYLVMNYERGPLFVRFVVYEYKSSQLVTQMEFGFIPEAVFPEKFNY